jgi:acid phosphatase type 7
MKKILGMILLLFTIHTQAKTASIQSLYLTWDNEDTATTMSVRVLTLEKTKKPILHYSTTLQRSKGKYSFSAAAQQSSIPGTPLHITTFLLQKLSPDTNYYFVYEDENHTAGEEQFFRTLPNDDSAIEFIQGGDMSASKAIETIAKKSITDETMALLIGGDVAYANGKTSNYKMWLKWFEIMNRSMRTPNGRLIPLIVSVGNHEVNGQATSDLYKKSPFYSHFFLQDESSYFKRRLGHHSMLYVLDSGHLTSHGGEQSKWLHKNMQMDTDIQHKFALYHVPLYPTFRDYDGSLSKSGRQHWLPLFDKNKLSMAFENHDHALKRTHLLHAGAIVKKEGTIYVGDGCWGVGPRPSEKRWYHTVAQSEQHVWRVQISTDSIHSEAIGSTGEILDRFELQNRTVIDEMVSKKSKMPSETHPVAQRVDTSFSQKL